MPVYVLGDSVFVDGKRGQITIFIIVGIVLLIGVSIFFLLRQSSFTDVFEQDSQRVVTERVSSEFRPVQEFITSCLRDVAVDGIRSAGRHGGYVYHDELVAFRNDPTSSAANSIYFWPRNQDYKVAYWWHMISEDTCLQTNTCKFSSNRPELTGGPNSIEAQLEQFIENEIARCLDDFSFLREQGFDIEVGQGISADVTIASEDVFVELRKPVSASVGNRDQQLNLYATRLDVELAKMYELAAQIYDYQARNAVFETQLIELISLYSGTTRDALLPPFYDPLVTRIGGNTRTLWTRTEIKSTLMSILASYIPMVSLYESRDFTPRVYEDDYHTSIFSAMIFSVDNSALDQRYDVTFDYKSWWDMHLRIGRSEIVEPEKMNVPALDNDKFLGRMISQVMPMNYQFGYDVSYPVLVTIRSDEAFGGDGFTFKFALESNVRDNMPVSESFGGPSDMSLPSSFFQSLFCREDNFNSGDISLRVVDSITGESLEGVSIDYHCASDSCSIGRTLNTDNGAMFKGKLPVCAGGTLEVSMLGYENKLIPLSTSLGADADIPTIQLNPFYEVDVKIRVFGRVKSPSGSWSFDWNSVDLRDGESVVLGLNKIAEDDFDSEHSAVAFFEGPNSVSRIDIVPGTYEVFGQLVIDTDLNPNLDEVVIPAETRREGGFLGIGATEYDLEEIRFGNIFPQGMVFLDDDHGGPWTVSSSQLEQIANSGEPLTLYVIASPYIERGLSLNYDDLREFGRADYYSGINRDAIEPCFGVDCP